MKKNALTLSFEFFPPKTSDGIATLDNTVKELITVNPDFFSVTFGAGGSTRDGTLETVKKLQKTKISIAPHLASVGLTRDEVKAIIKNYQDIGIKRVVAIRGDLPSGMGHVAELRYAHELVSLIRETVQDAFHIEVAAYPEMHPQAADASHDLQNLKKKIEAGANSAITQYFFNADAYFYYVDACRKEGIAIPIVPGIMPITHFAKLVRFSDMCGAEIPRWIRHRLEVYKDDPEALSAFGLEVVYMLCERLISNGAPGLHFYTLNHHEPCVQLLKLLNL